MAPNLFWFERSGQDLGVAIATRTPPPSIDIAFDDQCSHRSFTQRLDQLWWAFGPGRRRIQRTEFVAACLSIGKALNINPSAVAGRRTCSSRPDRDRGVNRSQFDARLVEVVRRYAAGPALRDQVRFLDVLLGRVLRTAPLAYRPLAQVPRPTLLRPPILSVARPQLRRVSSAPIVGRGTAIDQVEKETPIRAVPVAPRALPTREFAIPWMMRATVSTGEAGFRGWARPTTAAAVTLVRAPVAVRPLKPMVAGLIDLVGYRMPPMCIEAVALRQARRPRSASVLSRCLSLEPRSSPSCAIASLHLQAHQAKFS